MNSTGKVIYIVYDGRACGGDTDDAQVLAVTHGKREALEHARKYSGAVYAYDEELPWKGKGRMQLVNERRVIDNQGANHEPR